MSITAQRRRLVRRPRWLARRLRRSSHTTAGYVYLIEAVGSGRLKIGHGRSATVRFAALRTASPFPLRLLRAIPTADSAALERRLHARYAAFQVHGEWYALPRDLLAALLREAFGGRSAPDART